MAILIDSDAAYGMSLHIRANTAAVFQQEPPLSETPRIEPPKDEATRNATERAQGMLLVRLTSLIEDIPSDQRDLFERDVISTYDRYVTTQILNGQSVEMAHNSAQREFLYAMHSHLYQAQFMPGQEAHPLPREQFDTAYQEGIAQAQAGFDIWDPDFNYTDTEDLARAEPLNAEAAEDALQWRMMYRLVHDIYKARSNISISQSEFQSQMKLHTRAIAEGQDPLSIEWVFGKQQKPLITIDIQDAFRDHPLPFSRYAGPAMEPQS